MKTSLLQTRTFTIKNSFLYYDRDFTFFNYEFMNKIDSVFELRLDLYGYSIIDLENVFSFKGFLCVKLVMWDMSNNAVKKLMEYSVACATDKFDKYAQ